jgi:hypothetical protein
VRCGDGGDTVGEVTRRREEMFPYMREVPKGVRTGEVSGSATAKQLPTIDCQAARIVAATDNAGNVYLGGVGVTAPDGTTDTTSGFLLDAGDSTEWIPIDNLNKLYIICDNAGDDILYMLVL